MSEAGVGIELTVKRCEGSYWGDENAVKLIYGDGSQVVKISKNHWIVHWSESYDM